MSRYMVEGATRADYRGQVMAVNHARAEQLRAYWRNVVALMESGLSPSTIRFALDDSYRKAFPKAAR